MTTTNNLILTSNTSGNFLWHQKEIDQTGKIMTLSGWDPSGLMQPGTVFIDHTQPYDTSTKNYPHYRCGEIKERRNHKGRFTDDKLALNSYFKAEMVFFVPDKDFSK